MYATSLKVCNMRNHHGLILPVLCTFGNIQSYMRGEQLLAYSHEGVEDLLFLLFTTLLKTATGSALPVQTSATHTLEFGI